MQSKEQKLWTRLAQNLEANFNERFHSTPDTIAILPNSLKNQLIGLLIIAALVMFPYLLVLGITLGNFSAARQALPFCAILLLFCLYPILTTTNYDNYVIFNFTDRYLYIEKRFFWLPTSRRQISFDKIDSFYYTSKRQGRRLPNFNVLSVALKNGLKFTVQEFSGAEKSSHQLNEILVLHHENSR